MSSHTPLPDLVHPLATVRSFDGATVTTIYQDLGLPIPFASLFLDLFNGTDVFVAISFDLVTDHILLAPGQRTHYGLGAGGVIWQKGQTFIRSLVNGTTGLYIANFMGR